MQNCTSKLQPGSIILLHNGATNTPEALPKIIEAIQGQGYKIIPISKLLLKDKYTTDMQIKCARLSKSLTDKHKNHRNISFLFPEKLINNIFLITQ